MMDKLYNLIKKYERKGDFTYTKVTDSMISQAEERLGLKLPEQFVWYLKTFGHGGIIGIDLMGFGLDGSMVFVDYTLEYRTHGLPNEFIVIEHCGEWLYCINSKDGTVVSWSMWGPVSIRIEYNDFENYFIESINDGLEDYLEELAEEEEDSKSDL